MDTSDTSGTAHTVPLTAVGASPPSGVKPDKPKGGGPSRRARMVMLGIIILVLAAGIFLVVWYTMLRGHGGVPASARANASAGQTHPGSVTPESPTTTATPSPSSSKSPSAKATPTALPVFKLPPGLQPLQADINSPSRATQALAVVPAERASFMHGPSLLPAGDKLSIDPRTLELVNHNEHIATVMATDSHGQRYQLGLYRKDSNSPWLLAISKEV